MQKRRGNIWENDGSFWLYCCFLPRIQHRDCGSELRDRTTYVQRIYTSITHVEGAEVVFLIGPSPLERITNGGWSASKAWYRAVMLSSMRLRLGGMSRLQGMGLCQGHPLWSAAPEGELPDQQAGCQRVLFQQGKRNNNLLSLKPFQVSQKYSEQTWLFISEVIS